MQRLLPHEASTTWWGGTEPWTSVQLRRRRPKAVDGLAISSQSPFSLSVRILPSRTEVPSYADFF